MFETTIAGSLPRPAWLAEPEALKGGWKLSGAELEAGKKRACEEWIRNQEDAGIDILTDGEVFRKHFVHSFLEKIVGIDQNIKEMDQDIHRGLIFYIHLLISIKSLRT